MSSDKYSKATASLPPDFVNHLRSVFDKLDKGNNGYIKISDLEKYWKAHYHLDESVTNSPIIKRLNEIAPANMGLVSFPRLCTGVKEALMQSKTHKNRKVSFLYALSIAEDPSDSENRTKTSDEDIDESNFNVVCYSPPTSPKSPRPVRDYSGEEMEIQKLLDSGLDLLTQVKSWYSRQKSQIYNCEIADVPREDLERIKHINSKLENILTAQRSKNTISNGASPRTAPDQNQELNELKERVFKLEGEKSHLIRELFQLKAQIQSPVPKSYMIDV